MSVVSLDFETHYNSKLRYSLRTLLAETYVKSELFDPYLLAVCDGTTSWAGHPKDFNWAALDGQTIVSHNKRFDYQVWMEMARRKMCPQPAFKDYYCTADMSSYICNRRALDDAVEFLFGVKLDKTARANADGKHWPQDFSEAERAAMLKYAPADALWCFRLWDKYSAQWPELERRLSNQTIAQGIRGIQIDTALLDDYLVQAHEIKLNTEKVIPWLADSVDDDSWEEFNIKPTSSKCTAEMCKREGIPTPPVKAHEGEEAFEEWEATYGKQHTWIGALSSWRSVNKLYKTFLLMKERLRPDGTMPFELKYFGSHSGRWSGAGKMNMQNPRKKPLLANERGLMETDEVRIDSALREKKKTGALPAWVKYSLDFRKLLIPRPGKIMITSDLAQIEPRVLAWLTGNTALLNAIRGGESVYTAFARANMGYTGGAMDKDSDYYKLIKIQVLGLGYQAGWRKFVTIAAAGGMDITKDDPEFIFTPDPFTGELKSESGFGTTSKKIVAEFREKNPKIVALWSTLDGAFKRSIGDNFIITMPSGRKMTYRSVRQSMRIDADPVTGKPKRSWVFTAESSGRRDTYYGGKLTENLVQATARDVFATQLIALEDAGHSVLFSSHDEAICECEPTVTAADIEKIMSECPAWMPGLPVAAEAKVVPFYTK